MRRMSFTIFSAVSFTGPDFCLVLLGTSSLLYGSRRPALQICRAAARDGSVLASSPWTVDHCHCPPLFFRPERIHGLRAQDKAEKSLMQITIGIDISKETVVAYRLPDNQSIQVANDRAGQKTLVRRIGKQNGSLVVFEATGAYHRCLEAALAANGTPFAKVNPRQARRFAVDNWPRLIASTRSC